MKLPRTWTGWKKLFWLALRRCPIDHSPLVHDVFAWGTEPWLYCFTCEGVSMWPRGVLWALRMNAQPEETA